MIRMAQRALTLDRLVEGSTTGPDRPAASTQRSSSVRSLGNSQEDVGLETSMPYLISHRRLVGCCKMEGKIKPRSALDFALERESDFYIWSFLSAHISK